MARPGQPLLTYPVDALGPMPVPLSAVEWWRSDLQLSFSNWGGQRLGKQLIGTQFGTAPPLREVAPDGTYFNGRTVAQTMYGAQPQYDGGVWLGTGLGTLLVTGSHPWMYFVARVRSLSAVAAQTFASIGVGGDQRCRQAAAATRSVWFFGPSVSNGVEDFLPHRFKWWTDGSKAHFAVDQVDATVNTSTGIVGDISSVAVGCTTSANYFARASFALIMLCASRPTSGEESALDTWAKGYYGLP